MKMSLEQCPGEESGLEFTGSVNGMSKGACSFSLMLLSFVVPWFISGSNGFSDIRGMHNFVTSVSSKYKSQASLY